MSHRLKLKNRQFTFATFIRLVIFILIVFFLINYFSGQSEANILGDQTINLNPYWQKAINLLPQKSQESLQHLPDSPVYKAINDKVVKIQNESAGFPQKQIKEIQKAIIKDIYDKINKNIETN